MSDQTMRYVYGEDTASVQFELNSNDLYEKAAALGEIAGEAVFEFTTDEIRGRAVDPAIVTTCEAQSDGTRGIDAAVEVGFNLDAFLDALRSFAWTDGILRIEIPLDPEGQHDAEIQAAVDHPGQTEMISPIRPEDVRDFPDLGDYTYPYEFSVDAWKLKGMVGGIAEAAEEVARLSPGDGELLIAGDRGGESWNGPWSFGEELEWGMVIPELEGGEPAYYSADFLGDILDGLPPRESATVRFGPESPLQISTDDIQYHLSHRVHRDGSSTEEEA